jgi:hypothetical protein
MALVLSIPQVAAAVDEALGADVAVVGEEVVEAARAL